MNISIDIEKVTISDGKVIINVDHTQKKLFEDILKNSVKLSDLNPGDELFLKSLPIMM